MEEYLTEQDLFKIMSLAQYNNRNSSSPAKYRVSSATGHRKSVDGEQAVGNVSQRGGHHTHMSNYQNGDNVAI